jgi:tetratricopeptide (TPR) repeat protein
MVYISRQEYMDRLDAHAAGEGLPLVIAGESGGGKSALLANWTHTRGERHPETPVLVHFIGAAPDSADWMAMLRRLLGEFQRKFAIQIEIPDQPDALRTTFANALHMVAARSRLVLVLDALNQIEDRDGAPDLVWLPPVIPTNVRLVVSTLPGRSWDDLNKRGWPVMTVEPLTVPEREELIVRYLKSYSKALSPGTAHRIAAAPQTGNGLYLCTLLNELRQFGSYEKLNERIDWYLQAATLIELYRKVIERWEQDYGRLDPACENLVRKSLVALWAARLGLYETELLELLGTSGSPLPQAYWTPFYLAAGTTLKNRGLFLSLADDFMREAVKKLYLPTEGDQRNAHRTLAEYFTQHTTRDSTKWETLWQWREAGDWQAMANLLAEKVYFCLLWIQKRNEIISYWARIEERSPIRMEHVYASIIQQPSLDPGYASIIGDLLFDSGMTEAALRIRAELVSHYRDAGEAEELVLALSDQARSLHARGDLDGAMTLYKEVERACRQLGQQEDLSLSQGNQACIPSSQDDPDDGVVSVPLAQVSVERVLDSKTELVASLCAQGLILMARGDLDSAQASFTEAECCSRDLVNRDWMARSLEYRARVLLARKDLGGALALFGQSSHIYRELGNRDELQGSLERQAHVLYERGDLEDALALFKEQERICRELGGLEQLQSSLVNQAIILYAQGCLDQSMAMSKEVECSCRGSRNRDILGKSLGLQGLILERQGDPNSAIEHYKEQEHICRELGNKLALARSLSNQAVILSRDRVNLQLARTRLEEAIELWSDVGGMDMEIAQARGQLLQLQMGIGTGRVGRMIAGVLKVLIATVIGAVGIRLGLWKPWLWVIGGPLAILSAFVLVVGVSPRVNAAFNRCIRQWLAESQKE